MVSGLLAPPRQFKAAHTLGDGRGHTPLAPFDLLTDPICRRDCRGVAIGAKACMQSPVRALKEVHFDQRASRTRTAPADRVGWVLRDP